MIIVHCPDFYTSKIPLRVVHKIWWEDFGYNSADDDFYDAQYDLRLVDRFELSTEDLSSLRQLATGPGIVQAVLLSVLPSDIVQQCYDAGRIISLQGTYRERAERMFTFWHMQKTAFQFARQSNIDFYQNMFQQLMNFMKEDTDPLVNAVIRYQDFPVISSFLPLLEAVAADRGLTVPALDSNLQTWFDSTVPSTPLIQNSTEYHDDFTAIWTEIKTKSPYTYTDYTTVLSADNQTKFRNLMDYLETARNW